MMKSLIYLVIAQLWKYIPDANLQNNHGTLESKSGTWIWADKHWDKDFKRGLPEVFVTVPSNGETSSQAITLGDDGEFVKETQGKKATRV